MPSTVESRRANVLLPEPDVPMMAILWWMGIATAIGSVGRYWDLSIVNPRTNNENIVAVIERFEEPRIERRENTDLTNAAVNPCFIRVSSVANIFVIGKRSPNRPQATLAVSPRHRVTRDFPTVAATTIATVSWLR